LNAATGLPVRTRTEVEEDYDESGRHSGLSAAGFEESFIYRTLQPNGKKKSDFMNVFFAIVICDTSFNKSNMTGG
jgi:hypothetical protein